MPRRGSPYGRGWARAREFVLNRDDRTCQLCGRPATQVDHILPAGETTPALWLDPANLRAVCGRCNAGRARRREAARARVNRQAAAVRPW